MTARHRRRGRRAGSVAVEFALVALTFMGLLLFTAELAFRLYAQAALDYATIRAARLLAVDSTQALSASQAAFQNVTFCPLLAPMLDCGNVLVTLRPIASDYLTDSQSNPPTLTGALAAPATFDPGQGLALMLLQVVYLGPPLTWPLSAGALASHNGASGSALVSSAPYANEY